MNNSRGMDSLAAELPKPGEVARKLAIKYGLTARVGCEIEFYVDPVPARLDWLLSKVAIEVGAAEPLFLRLEEEVGPGQLEVSTRASDDPDALASAMTRLRQELECALARQGLTIDWRSFECAQRPSCALHVHLSLHDPSGRNVFCRGETGEESLTLLRVIDGLLDTLPDLMPIFAPTENCYGRYVEVPFPNVSFSPSRVCWGPDNRAAAIRLPPLGAALDRRRIEHRVAGASADLECVLAGILIGVDVGLASTREAPRHLPIFGHPGHPLYDLPSLPGSLAEATRAFMGRGQALLKNFSAELAIEAGRDVKV